MASVARSSSLLRRISVPGTGRQNHGKHLQALALAPEQLYKVFPGLQIMPIALYHSH